MFLVAAAMIRSLFSLLFICCLALIALNWLVSLLSSRYFHRDIHCSPSFANELVSPIFRSSNQIGLEGCAALDVVLENLKNLRELDLRYVDVCCLDFAIYVDPAQFYPPFLH